MELKVLNLNLQDVNSYKMEVFRLFIYKNETYTASIPY